MDRNTTPDKSPYRASAQRQAANVPNVPKKPKRLGVRLDPARVLERAILKRISTMTGKRGEDWLRELLSLGFLTEGRWLRIECSDARGRFAPSSARALSNSYAQYLERTRGEKTPRNLPAPVTPAALSCSAAPSSSITASKPVAAESARAAGAEAVGTGAVGTGAARDMASISRRQARDAEAPVPALTVRSGSKPLAHLARVIG